MRAPYVPMIDISQWQGADFDMAVPAAAGVKVVMVRLGIGREEDPYAMQWINEILDQGMQWMGYWFIDKPGEIEAEEQAAAFIDAYYSTPQPNGAPLWIDVESYKGPQLSRNVWSAYLNCIKSVLSMEGLPQGVYSNQNHWDHEVRLSWAHIPRIIASWVNHNLSEDEATPPQDPNTWDEWAFLHKPQGPAMPMASRDWQIWQFSSRGRGDWLGSSVNTVDCNIMTQEAYESWFPVARTA